MINSNNSKSGSGNLSSEIIDQLFTMQNEIRELRSELHTLKQLNASYLSRLERLENFKNNSINDVTDMLNKPTENPKVVTRESSPTSLINVSAAISPFNNNLLKPNRQINPLNQNSALFQKRCNKTFDSEYLIESVVNNTYLMVENGNMTDGTLIELINGYYMRQEKEYSKYRVIVIFDS